MQSISLHDKNQIKEKVHFAIPGNDDKIDSGFQFPRIE
jgi:ribosomal protein S2